jgi:hypothetical protein
MQTKPFLNDMSYLLIGVVPAGSTLLRQNFFYESQPTILGTRMLESQ